MGLVNQVVAHDNLREQTRHLALKMCELPPIALQMTKKAVVHAYHSTLEQHLELVSALQAITQRTEDHFTALTGQQLRKSQTFKHF